MKKLIILFLTIIMIMGGIVDSFAVLEVGQRNVFPKADCEKLLTYRGTPIRTTYVAYIKDGIEYPAYCLDSTVDGVGERGEYVVNGADKLRNIDVWRAIINGYPYKSLEELGAANGQEAFTATKQAVYTMIYNRSTSDYGAVDSDSGRRTYQIYCNIVNAARSSGEVIVDNVYTNLHVISNEWQIYNNENILYKEYYADSNVTSGNYTILLNGDIPAGTIIIDDNGQEKNEFRMNEHFKILIPMSSLEQSGNFRIDATAKLETKPVMFGTTTIPGTQDYALTGFMYEEVGSSIQENYLENSTQISILKKDEESEEVLENVKFDLLNSDEEKLLEDLTTDKDGKILIENIMPGKYYIKEVECLEGYELNTEIYEVQIEYGEQKEVVITNKKIIPPPEPEPEPEPEPQPEPKPEIIPEPEKPEETVSVVESPPQIIVVQKEIRVLPRTGY